MWSRGLGRRLFFFEGFGEREGKKKKVSFFPLFFHHSKKTQKTINLVFPLFPLLT